MKKQTPLIVPILWTLNAAMWVLVFGLDLCYPPQLPAIVVLHGLCAVVGVVNGVLQWLHFKKQDPADKNEKTRDE